MLYFTMIPFQGAIASILAIIALIVLWDESNSMLWWIILGLLITDYLFTNSLKESLKLYGEEDKATIKWGIIATVYGVHPLRETLS